MYDEIAAAFPEIERYAPIFAWGDTIYQPFNRVTLGSELLAHEALHGLRQGLRPEDWWRLYIDDPLFRLDEEVAAHRAELHERNRHTPTRRGRRQNAGLVADRLRSRLYQWPPGLLSREKAKRLITERY